MAIMMPAVRQLDSPFDDDGSIAASLEDFEEQEQTSPLSDLPLQHSGFRSDESEPDDDSSSGTPWSPPGFPRSTSDPGSWFHHNTLRRMQLQPSIILSRSRQSNPEYLDAQEDDDDDEEEAEEKEKEKEEQEQEQGDEDANEEPEDLTLAANIPLPSGTSSPTKDRSPEPEELRSDGDEVVHDFDDQTSEQAPSNFIRFAIRAEVQHREPFLPILNFFHSKIDAIRRTKLSTVLSVFIGLFAVSLFQAILVPPAPAPVPDLVKLSALAKSFEPLIFYSENGVAQITALQETSVAVWDLGESVNRSNMTSAPIIMQSLNELSGNLNTLGLELTRFFADVDADVDGILIVMDWARRELINVNRRGEPPIPGQIYDYVHGMLNRGGLLETPAGPTFLGSLVINVFGSSSPQRTRATLTRTFYEFLGVLEESINSELTHSVALFALFESIDRQFSNIQHTVAREKDTQDRLENDLLSSLWTRVIGANPALVRKYEKNKSLLLTVRERTVSNKLLITQHHSRLQTLKFNLETLRQRLISPLIKRNDSLSLDFDNVSVVEGQIKGLEGTYEYLRAVRDRQKSKLLEMVYGSRSMRSNLVSEQERREID